MQNEPLYLDTETYSELGLKEAGTYKYAENCEIMLLTYAFGDGPVECWDHNDGLPFPAEILAHEGEVIAHNVMFDRNVLRLGNLKIEIPIEQWRCTMAQAMSHALPGGLEDVASLMGLPPDQRKLAQGKKLIQRFCKPAPRNHKADRYSKATHPELWELFRDYAKQDIVVLREVHKRLPTWNWKPEDIAHWHLDQVINDRGFAVDMELARAGAAAAIKEKQSLETRFQALTGGLKPTQRQAVLAFINAEYGLQLDSTAKYIAQPMVDAKDTPETLREIFQIILQANKTSTAKYATVAEGVSADGRYHGGLQFAGAQRTRRWAGRGFQGQNLPSRGLPPSEQVELYIEMLKAGVHDLFFDDLMLYGAAALRGVVIAGE